MKHKYAEVIKAWADGATVQVKNNNEVWQDTCPLWSEFREYRIKPAEKVVRYLWAFRKDDEIRGEHGWLYTNSFVSDEEMEAQKKLRPDVKYIKLEWSREEFDE